MNIGAQLMIDDDATATLVLARLNLRAARSAKAISAFPISLEFVMSGLEQVPVGELWKDVHYDLTLHLKLLQCDLLYCLGRLDECLQIAEEIKSRARSALDSSEASFAIIRILGCRGELLQSISVGLALLNDLGEAFPSHPGNLRVMISILQTKYALRERTYASILDLPTMTDKTHLLVLKTINCLTHFMFLAPCAELAVLTNLRVVRLSLRYGISKHSPFGFSVYGYIMSTMGNFQEAFGWGLTALELQNKTGDDFVGRTSLFNVVYAYLYHLRRPIVDSMEPLLKAYSYGLRSGEFQYAIASCSQYTFLYLELGFPLSLLESDISSFVSRTEEQHHEVPLQMLQIYYQSILNLRGASGDSATLDGPIMTEEELTLNATINNGKLKTMPYYTMFYMKSWLAYLFGDYERSFDFADVVFSERPAKDRRVDAAAFYIGQCAFHSALAGLIVLRRKAGSHRRRRNRAQRLVQYWTKFLVVWAKKGVAHVDHKILLLRAEKMSAMGYKNTGDVDAGFEEALELSAESGFVPDLAVAAERAGEHYLATGRPDLAKPRLLLAHSEYSKWEVTGKVEQMLEKNTQTYWLKPTRRMATHFATTYPQSVN